MIRRLTLIGVLALAIFTGAVAVAPGANAAYKIYGTVECFEGPFVGMWVSTNTGANGWANWWGESYPGWYWVANYSKNVPTSASLVHVAVGCGGSPSRWAHTYYGNVRVSTGYFAARKDWICFESQPFVYSCI